MNPAASRVSHVYTPEWIAQQVRKHGQRPEYLRPKHFRFWTSDDCQPARDRIEEWVDLMPLAKRANLISRLRLPESFEETYNELFVGFSLRQIGHPVEYEVNMDGLTPDWRVGEAGDSFIVEVVSSMPPDERADSDDNWERFRLRLCNLEGNAYLSLLPAMASEPGEIIPIPDAQEQKRMIGEVEKWLKSELREGDRIDFGGTEIAYFGQVASTDRVHCGAAMTSFMVEVGPLRTSLMEKAKRYSSAVEKYRMPFVVSVVLHSNTGRGLDDLESAVLGTERIRLVRQRGATHFQEQFYRDADGVFAKYVTLSAVTLATPTALGISHQVLFNPSAKYPLRTNAFPTGND